MFTILATAAVKSAMVFALAWVITKMMRHQSAAARHLVWTSAIAAALMLPVASLWMPAWHLPAPAAWREAAAVFQVSATAAGESASAAVGRSNPTTARTGPIAMRNWRAIILFVWAFGSALVLLQMLLGYAAIWRLRRSMTRSVGRVEGVEILESPAGTMPMTAGIWKPAVFLPADSSAWPDARRRAVLAHELAHVTRSDAATQLLARAAVALYWWNPLAWLAWREFVKERERAADDLVLASGLSATDYAGHLLEIARRLAASPAMAVAMARKSQLEGRLLAILDSNASRKSAGRWSAVAAAICAIAVMAPLAAVRAQDTQTLHADVAATIRSAQSQRDPAMLEKIATAAEDQRKFDVARTLLEAALEIRGQISGATSADYAMGLMKLANLELRQHGLLSAASLYSLASDLLANRPEQAAALVRLGEIAMANKDLDGAATLFARAQAADPTKAAVAMVWLADVRARQHNFDEAATLYQSAIATEDPKSVSAAVAMSMYASFLKKQGRTGEADSYLDRAKQTYLSLAMRPQPKQEGSGPYRIGGSVSAPRVLSKVEPEYSAEARLGGLQGTVVMALTVGEDGMAHDIVVTRPLGLGLDDKAIEAVSQWRFAPGTKAGEPVPVYATIEVNFRLL